jgi:hypothetical protein
VNIKNKLKLKQANKLIKNKCEYSDTNARKF